MLGHAAYSLSEVFLFKMPDVHHEGRETPTGVKGLQSTDVQRRKMKIRNTKQTCWYFGNKLNMNLLIQ